jgi:meso-butanediol dehydrogenase / (S,S)-butanediol dehydrogenase / diacetyl reductase
MSESTAVDFSLKGKVALVTGAGRGIGQGIALSLARAGADLVLADYDLSIAEEAAAKIRAVGWRAIALQVDVSQADSVATMIEQVRHEFGRLDVAVNNAGVVSLGKVDELPVSEWDRIMNINARGVFLCCQAELKLMREHQFGRIINLASIAGKVGFPDLAHYSTSKFAVIGFSNAKRGFADGGASQEKRKSNPGNGSSQASCPKGKRKPSKTWANWRFTWPVHRMSLDRR